MATRLSQLDLELRSLPVDKQQQIRGQFLEMFERHQMNKSQIAVDDNTEEYLPAIYIAIFVFAVLLLARFIKHATGKPKKMKIKPAFKK